MTDKAKRQTLLVVASGRHESGLHGIWHTEAHFFFGQKFLAGSERAGKYDRVGLSSSEVRVRWQHDTGNPGDYAPVIRFDLEYSQARKLGQRIMKAAATIRERHEEITREALIAELKATRVTHAGDAWTWEPVAREAEAA